jgi:hypothetical protein
MNDAKNIGMDLHQATNCFQPPACRIRNRRRRHRRNMNLQKKQDTQSLPTLHGLEKPVGISHRSAGFSSPKALGRGRCKFILLLRRVCWPLDRGSSQGESDFHLGRRFDG